MIRRNISISIFLFIHLIALYAASPVYFSYSPVNQVYDYRKGNNLEIIDDYRNINGKEEVEKLIVTVDDDEEHQSYEFLFENGLLKTEISHVHDLTRTNYEYDNEKRLIKVSNDFTYNYLSDNCREYYYCGEKKKREEVFEASSLMRIKTIKFTKSFVSNGTSFIPTGTVEDGHDEQEFYYNEDNNLVHFIERSWNFMGKKSEHPKEIQFYYNNDKKIEKIMSGYENDIRDIYYIFYDESGNMKRIIVKDSLSNCKKEILFTDYDKYGNWHKSQTIFHDKTVKTVLREFLYVK